MIAAFASFFHEHHGADGHRKHNRNEDNCEGCLHRVTSLRDPRPLTGRIFAVQNEPRVNVLRCCFAAKAVFCFLFWHRWFAWRPVFISRRGENRRLVWLQYVERRWTEGITSGLGPRWIYRRMRTPGEGDF